jgi:NAD(P)-dependent dehydrogenase (short-subunit alcohol dehydrogenase family)
VATHRELARCTTYDEGARWLTAHPVPPETVYQYSKEALIVWTMVRAGALFREHGVRINCVSPGPVDTPILEDFRSTLGQAKVAQAIDISDGQACRRTSHRS